MKKSNTMTIKTKLNNKVNKEWRKLNDDEKINAIKAMLWTAKHIAESNTSKNGDSKPLPYLENMKKENVLDDDIILDDDITSYIGMCYIEIMDNIASEKEYDSLSELLFKSVWNVVRRDYKVMKKSINALTEHDADGNALIDIESFSNHNNDFNPEYIAIRNTMIENKISNDKERHICSLIYQGYNYNEIADIMNTTENSIKSIIKRMKKR